MLFHGVSRVSQVRRYSAPQVAAIVRVGVVGLELKPAMLFSSDSQEEVFYE